MYNFQRLKLLFGARGRQLYVLYPDDIVFLNESKCIIYYDDIKGENIYGGFSVYEQDNNVVERWNAIKILKEQIIIAKTKRPENPILFQLANEDRFSSIDTMNSYLSKVTKT